MLQRIVHANLVVQDLDRTLRFYRDLLGFKVAFAATTEDPKLAEALGVKEGVRMRWALIRLGDDENGPFLDVEQWQLPKGVAGPRSSCNDIGIRRIAMQVADIEKAYKDLKGRGVEFLSSPQTVGIPEIGDFKLCCFRDPDGIVLELVQASL
jgi:catechol 2,3-dioxygenase-like lactoylglutathione lyase family enzyme